MCVYFRWFLSCLISLIFFNFINKHFTPQYMEIVDIYYFGKNSAKCLIFYLIAFLSQCRQFLAKEFDLICDLNLIQVTIYRLKFF